MIRKHYCFAQTTAHLDWGRGPAVGFQADSPACHTPAKTVLKLPFSPHTPPPPQRELNTLYPRCLSQTTPPYPSASSSPPQEIARPDVFWYDAPTKVDLPFNIVGLLAFEFWAMQFVELKRWQDFKNPGSVDADPLFPNNKLAPHEVSLTERFFGSLPFLAFAWELACLMGSLF